MVRQWPSYAQDTEARVLSGLLSLHSLVSEQVAQLAGAKPVLGLGGEVGGWMCVEDVVLEFRAGVQVPALLRSVPGEESDPAPAFKELPV